METASVRAKRVTASAAGASSRRVCREKSGIDRGGSAAGSAPTVRMAVTDSPKAAFSPSAARLPATMAMIMYGSRGRKRRAAIPVSSVTSPTAVT